LVISLIADDSPIMRKIIKTNLEKADVRKVYEAKDGKDALKMLKADTDINLLFLDINMPEVDGTEVLRALAGSGRINSLKVIVISSEIEQHRDHLTSLKIGDFIPKPFNLHSFEEVAIPIVEQLKCESPSGNNGIGREKLDALFQGKKRECYIEGSRLYIDCETQRLSIDIATFLENAQIAK